MIPREAVDIARNVLLKIMFDYHEDNPDRHLSESPSDMAATALREIDRNIGFLVITKEALKELYLRRANLPQSTYQEIYNRIEYAYRQIDGSFKIPNSYDGDILRIFLSEFLNCPATPVYHCKAEDTSQMEPLRCVHCGKAVSTPVPTNTVVRAYIECPECISKRDGSGTEAHGEETTGVQIHHQKTCPRCGHDKYRGTWEDTTLAKCERCGHIWRAINICKEADHE